MTDSVISRLRWRCRRGTKELDFLLRWYLDQRFAAETAQRQAAFERLLAAEDDALWDWMLARQTLADTGMQAIVDEIRAHHRL